MSHKIFTTRFKVILYSFNRKSPLYFDLYDECDFDGAPLADPDLEVRADERVINDDIKDLVNTLNKELPSKLEALGRMPGSEHPLVPSPAPIDEHSYPAQKYLKEFFADKHSYYIKNTSHNINWKAIPVTASYKQIAAAYKEYLRLKFERVRAEIANKDLYDLVGDTVDEHDITEAVISIGHYSVSLEKPSLQISFVLSVDKLKEIGCNPYIMENSIIDFYVDFYGDTNETELIVGEYKGPSTKEECLSIMNASTSEDIEKSIHTRRFVGFVTSVKYSVDPGKVPTCTLTCEGLGGMLSRVNIVKDRALVTFFEEFPYDIPQPGPTLFQDVFNSKNFDEIFEQVITSVLYVTRFFKCDASSLVKDPRFLEIKGLLYTDQDALSPDGKQICGKKGISFYRREEWPEKFVTTLYIATLLYFKVRQKYKPQILQAYNDFVRTKDVFSEKEKEILNALEYVKRKTEFCDIVAVQEGDQYTIRAYTLQIKNAFRVFYNEFASGTDILSQIFPSTFIYVFEDEPGTLICRIPRVNLTLYDHEDPNVKKHFVVPKEVILSYSWSRNDFDLLTRQDYTPVMHIEQTDIPFVWPFEDPQVLIKYGPRLAPKSTNPNASLFHLNYLSKFCAVALGWKNASTRNLEVTVVNDGTRYCLGRTYFIPDVFGDKTGWVGMLHSMDYDYSVREVPTILLRFTFARRVSL